MDIEQSYEARTSDRSDGGVLVRVERRRRWSDEEKLTILKETTEPGAIMAVVARRHGIGTGSSTHGAGNCCRERWRASCPLNWRVRRRRHDLAIWGGSRSRVEAG